MDEKKADERKEAKDDWYHETCRKAVDEGTAKIQAAVLRKAMKGLGTNEAKLNEVLGPSSKAQIQAIRRAFVTVDGAGKKQRDLIKDLKSETSRKYETLLVGLVMGPYEYDAHLVRQAVKGLGTNETQLSEVLCTRSPAEIHKICQVYEEKYIGRQLLKDVTSDTSGHLKNLYVNLITGRRKEGTNVDSDCQALYKAGEGRMGTNEKVFVELFSARTRSYVEKLYWKYAEKYNKGLDRVVRSEFSGNLRNALIPLCTPIDRYYTAKLTACMKGAGTKDNQLIRIICAQKERNLQKIAKQFLQTNNKTLKKWVSGDTSGNYGKLLVSTCHHWATIKH